MNNWFWPKAAVQETNFLSLRTAAIGKSGRSGHAARMTATEGVYRKGRVPRYQEIESLA